MFKKIFTASFVFALLFAASSVLAKPEFFMKELPTHPGLTCTTCHTPSPPSKTGEKDKHLNGTGKAYQKDHKLPPKK